MDTNQSQLEPCIKIIEEQQINNKSESHLSKQNNETENNNDNENNKNYNNENKQKYDPFLVFEDFVFQKKS